MNEILPDELEQIYRFAIDLGKSAGKILLDGIEKRRVDADDAAHEAVEKLNAVDIVTQTDNGTSTWRNVHQIKRLILFRRGRISSLCYSEPISEPLIRWRRDILERLLERVFDQR